MLPKSYRQDKYRPNSFYAMKYRSRTRIIAMILRTASYGATKTRIMYGAYLSNAQVRDYLGFMTERNLLYLDGATGEYRLTESGMTLLHTYEGISEMISVGVRERA